MSNHEVDGELLDSFCIAWETPDPVDITSRTVAMEAGMRLEEKLQEIIKPHGVYNVSVIITRLEYENAVQVESSSQIYVREETRVGKRVCRGHS